MLLSRDLKTLKFFQGADNLSANIAKPSNLTNDDIFVTRIPT